MATELTDLDLGEWSICIDPANEDSTIEIVKSKSGLGPVLKETDMSEHNEENDTEIEQFASEVLEEFNGLSAEEQADAIVGMALENAEFEEAVEDAAEVIKSLTENTVAKAKYDEVVEIVKKSGALIEKMKTAGHVTAEEGGLLDEIRKANGGADLSPEAAARIEAIEKAQAASDLKEAIAKARTFGFGKPEDVAPLLGRIAKGKTTPADAEAVEALLKQAGAIVKSAPHFKTVGEDAGNGGEVTPISKAKAAAVDIRKANPGMSEAQAMRQYWDEHPDEYAAMRQGQAA
jgi:DNA-binding transcriptional regulator YhcF (GntR family)